MLIIFYYSCSNFKGRSSFRESGQLYILKKLHRGSSPEVLDYASRSRLKTITMNIHLTTFCKLTTYFVFIFHGPFALAFTCTNVLEIMGQFLRAGVLHCRHGRTWAGGPGSSLPLFCSAISIYAQYFGKGGEQKIFFCVPIFQQNLQQTKNGWDQTAKLSQNTMR